MESAAWGFKVEIFSGKFGSKFLAEGKSIHEATKARRAAGHGQQPFESASCIARSSQACAPPR